MSFGFALLGAADIVTELNKVANVGHAGLRKAVDRTAAATAGQARGNAQKFRRSGDHVRSITHVAAQQTGESIIGFVGTNIAYGRRLELGFVGTDALGRTYSQKPRPWLDPTADYAADILEKEVSSVIEAAFS